MTISVRIAAVSILAAGFMIGDRTEFQVEMSDRRDGPRPVGLDGVPRVSPAGRFGLPVAISGWWENGNTFALDYNEVGNINAYQFRLAFSDTKVTAALTEKTGLVNAQFRGQSR